MTEMRPKRAHPCRVGDPMAEKELRQAPMVDSTVDPLVTKNLYQRRHTAKANPTMAVAQRTDEVARRGGPTKLRQERNDMVIYIYR